MKICVFSDSHGYAGNMIAATGLEKPDMCFFLGDGDRDLAALEKQYPEMPVYSVKGNCDFRSKERTTEIYNIEGVRFFVTHGHMFNVKYESSLETLASRAADAGADVALFGHTHRQNMSNVRGILLINPGSIGRGTYPCYAVIEIDSGDYTADLKVL